MFKTTIFSLLLISFLSKKFINSFLNRIFKMFILLKGIILVNGEDSNEIDKNNINDFYSKYQLAGASNYNDDDDMVEEKRSAFIPRLGKRIFNVPRVGKRVKFFKLMRPHLDKKFDSDSDESLDSYQINSKRLFNVPRMGK
jgi:hypothetical protein